MKSHMTEDYLSRPLLRSVVGDANTAKASHQWNRVLSRTRNPETGRSQFRRSRKKVLPTVLGAIIFLAIAGLAIAFFFSSRRRHTRCGRDWSSDVCSSDLDVKTVEIVGTEARLEAGFFSIYDTNFNRITYNSRTAPALVYES